MKRMFAVFGLCAALLGALPLFSTPAAAYSIYLCAPIRAGTSPGPGQFVAPTTGTKYSLDTRGCVMASAADLGDFQAAGFLLSTPTRSVAAKGIVADGTTIQIPAGSYIQSIVVEEDSGGTLTPSSLRIGTASGAADVLSATQVLANSVAAAGATSVGLRLFARTGPTTLYVTSTSNWNGGARVNVTIIYALY